VVLHGQVGGYGKIHFKTMLKQFLNFADLSTLMKILIPINEHYPLPQPYTQAMLLSYALAALNLASLSTAQQGLCQSAGIFHISGALSMFFLLFKFGTSIPT
jgi:hypothetical protein